MKINKKLPLFLQNEKDNEIFKIVISCIPKNTKVYLVGVAIRNAIYYKYFKKILPQRDFDVLLAGDFRLFIKNLRDKGFTYGKIRRKKSVVLKIKRVPKPEDIFKDYLYLDICLSEEKPPKCICNFTINGSMISLKDIFKESWFEKLISLPEALNDLKNKRIKVKNIIHPADLFACLRFMHLGFKQPTKEEVNLLLKNLGTIEKWRYPRNIKKLYSYVGGEKNARILARKLGIKQDIFNFEVIKTLNK